MSRTLVVLGSITALAIAIKEFFQAIETTFAAIERICMHAKAIWGYLRNLFPQRSKPKSAQPIILVPEPQIILAEDHAMESANRKQFWLALACFVLVVLVIGAAFYGARQLRENSSV